MPLYREHFHLVTRGDGGFAGRESVTWEEARGLALCLLTPDMQNRRIMDQLMRGAGVEPTAAMESDSQAMPPAVAGLVRVVTSVMAASP